VPKRKVTTSPFLKRGRGALPFLLILLIAESPHQGLIPVTDWR
jgi:hypothetical protein